MDLVGGRGLIGLISEGGAVRGDFEIQDLLDSGRTRDRIADGISRNAIPVEPGVGGIIRLPKKEQITPIGGELEIRERLSSARNLGPDQAMPAIRRGR